MLIASVAGLAAALWAFGAAGATDVFAATARIGWGGFALFFLYSLAAIVPLGSAWWAAAPDAGGGRVWLFCWARIVREGAADLLPFSQVGGLIIGARTLIAHGVAMPKAYASLIVDMTTELAAQLIFTLFGIAMFAVLLTADARADALLPLILGGTGVMILLIAAFFFAQRYAFRFAARIGAVLLPGSVAAMDSVGVELRRIYGHRGRVLAAFLFNLIAWSASAAGAWIALHLMGNPVPFWSVMTMEALIFTLRSVAFLIPGAIGIQEGGYVLLGPLLGLSPADALALSLVKRARDIAIGLPALLIWQGREARAVMKPGLS